MDIKRATIITHALHSRLQLVRGKLYCRKGFTIDEFIDANREYFEKASESIQKVHDLAVSQQMHWRMAAQMFIMTANDGPNGM